MTQQIIPTTVLTSTQSSVFPTEIYEQIIDSVYNNPYHHLPIASPEEMAFLKLITSTLYNSALTCRAWLPRSQYCLYRSIRLGPQFSTHRHEVFRRLTRSLLACPRTSDHIHMLAIQGSSASEVALETSFPLVMASRLPSLRALTLRQTTLLITSLFLGSIRTFPRLVTLVLSNVVFSNFVAFCRFLCAVPALRDLTLWNIIWQWGVPYEAMIRVIRNVPCVARLSLAFLTVSYFSILTTFFPRSDMTSPQGRE